MTNDQLDELMVKVGLRFGYPFARSHLVTFAKLVAAAERQQCIKIIETYRIPVGNSPAGEMAFDWTQEALTSICDEIRDKDKDENTSL